MYADLQIVVFVHPDIRYGDSNYQAMAMQLLFLVTKENKKDTMTEGKC